jgi:hypothetical protein
MEDGERAGWAAALDLLRLTAGAGLRRLADVAVIQATDFGKFHDPARLGNLDGPDVRRVLVEREMRASPVVVGEVGCGAGGFRREPERDPDTRGGSSR